MQKQQTVFYVIVIAQFCGRSLWFVGNAVLPQLQADFGWHASSLGYLTSSTLLGFIAGTLLFAIAGLVDKFSPSKIFFYSSLLASASNLLALVDLSSFSLVFSSRFLTGFFLAGIYPVGMKIAADWYEKGLGRALGYFLGALVLGTAFPHLLRNREFELPWQSVLYFTSFFAVAGGSLMLLFVGDGPFRRSSGKFQWNAIGEIFRSRQWRQAAFGYFGHMWELYAFWAFVPWAISYYTSLHTELNIQETLLAFIVIAIGGAGCVIGGKLSFTFGSKKIAQVALISSGVCCVLSPWMWNLSPSFFFVFISFWGLMVVADSPQFSALVAANAPASVRGSAITITTCIGFAITIVSIQLLNLLQNYMPGQYLFLVLAPGPLIGVLLLNRTFTI